MATLVDNGIAHIPKLISGDSADAFTALATGSGSTAEATGQTALVTENTLSGLARKAATISTPAAGKTLWSATWTASADSLTVREAGIFATAAGMLMRHVYAADIALNTDDTITIRLEYEQTRAA